MQIHLNAKFTKFTCYTNIMIFLYKSLQNTKLIDFFLKQNLNLFSELNFTIFNELIKVTL